VKDLRATALGAARAESLQPAPPGPGDSEKTMRLKNCSLEQSSRSGHLVPAVPHSTIIELQRHLREKFPEARHGTPQPAEPAPPAARFDLRHPDSFPRAAITEISPTHAASGLSLLVAALLEHDDSPSPLPGIALIDGCDQFDPASFSANARSNLLWARCQTIAQTLKTADLLLRDGNVPLVLLDLASFPATELRKIPGSSWHRLKQLCETNDSSLIVLTPQALLPCARLRLALRNQFELHHLDQHRQELVDALEAAPMLDRKSAY
jgi:hypothetical protein